MATVEYGNGYWRTQQGSSVVVCTDDNGIKTAVNMGCDRNSNKTAVNKDGLLYDVLPYEPSVTYINGVGVLSLEPQSTNLISYSEDLSNASWVKSGVDVSLSSQVSPSGSTNVYLVKESLLDEFHKVNSSLFSTVQGNYYSYSFFVKNNGVNQVSVTSSNFTDLEINSTFDLVNETSTSEKGYSSIERIGDYYRCTASGLCNLTRTQSLLFYTNREDIAFPFSYQGNGVSGVFLWGLQSEINQIPTSYIPTDGFTATRLADTGFKTPDISKWINSESFSFEFSLQLVKEQVTQVISLANSGDGYNNRIELVFSVGEDIVAITAIGSGSFIENNATVTSTLDRSVMSDYKINFNNGIITVYIDNSLMFTSSNSGVLQGLDKLFLSSFLNTSPLFANVKNIKITS